MEGLFVSRGWRRPELDGFAFGVVIRCLAEMGRRGHDSNYDFKPSHIEQPAQVGNRPNSSVMPR
jgi:hypothetical protein